jgi:hypothetical protein
VIVFQPKDLDASVHHTDILAAIAFNQTFPGHRLDESEETLLEEDADYRDYFAVGDWRVDWRMIGKRYSWEVRAPHRE